MCIYLRRHAKTKRLNAFLDAQRWTRKRMSTVSSAIWFKDIKNIIAYVFAWGPCIMTSRHDLTLGRDMFSQFTWRSQCTCMPRHCYICHITEFQLEIDDDDDDDNDMIDNLLPLHECIELDALKKDRDYIPLVLFAEEYSRIKSYWKRLKELEEQASLSELTSVFENLTILYGFTRPPTLEPHTSDRAGIHMVISD